MKTSPQHRNSLGPANGNVNAIPVSLSSTNVNHGAFAVWRAIPLDGGHTGDELKEPGFNCSNWKSREARGHSEIIQRNPLPFLFPSMLQLRRLALSFPTLLRVSPCSRESYPPVHFKPSPVRGWVVRVVWTNALTIYTYAHIYIYIW